MEVLNLTTKIDSDGYLRLNIPTNLMPGIINLVLVIDSLTDKKENKKYDFSDISGKLTWEGDALAVQRKLRDEWE